MPKISDERRGARRRQILKAAITRFARRGFHGTRVQDICRQARLSPGAVYLYFDSKDAIVRALAEEARAASEAVWAKTVKAGDASGLSRIEELFDLASSAADATAVRMSVQFWAQAFDNAFLSNAMLVAHEESVEQLVRLLRSEGDIARADAQALAEMVIATLRGFGLQRAIVPSIDLKPAARAFLRALGSELARAKRAKRSRKRSGKREPSGGAPRDRGKADGES